jgi:farnesyl-diphosphate farnesyltransferase
MGSKPDKNDLFIKDFIPRVSRTFALTIKFLPRGLRDSVYTSYLLCRVADTLEDSPYLKSDEKYARLSYLKDILESAFRGEHISKAAISSLYDSIDPGYGDDHRLLAESSKLFEILASLPAAHRPIIYRWAGEMAKGMAEYSRLKSAENEMIAALKDVEDWNRYCYYVAGTVGYMLTELFIQHYSLDGDLSSELLRLGNSFGLALQKVNVIKDAPVDRERGVCYLPLDVMKKHGLTPSAPGNPEDAQAVTNFVWELSDLTAVHLDDAIRYTTLIPHRYRGVRMFLTVPIFLAVETLNLINGNPLQAMAGPPVKLSRKDVTRLVKAATLRISSNKALQEYYDRLREKSR